MAEFTNPLAQDVAVNNNVLFTETPVAPCPRVRHREGSGIFTLKGGRYLVMFNGNVEIPTGGTTGDIELAIALNGEAIQGGTMVKTTAAVDVISNVAAAVFVDIPCNCCYTLSVKNIGEIPFTVEDANLVIIREVQ